MSNLQNIMDARSKLKNDEVQGKIDASQALRPTAANPVIKTPSPIDIAAPDTARGAIQEASNRGAFNVQATTEAPRTNGMSAQDRSDMLAAQQEESLRMTGQDDQTQNALAESRRFFSGIEETGLTQSDLMRITGAEDAQTARAMIEGRGGLTAEQQLELNQAMEQAKFDITKSKNEADLLTEEARIKQDVTDRFAPEFTKAKEAGQRTSESAFRIAGRAGMGSKSEDQQQQINDRQLEIEQSIAAEQRMEERMAIASARGASAEELETLSSQLNNAKAQRQEYQEQLELTQAGLDKAAIERAEFNTKTMLDALDKGFEYDPETDSFTAQEGKTKIDQDISNMLGYASDEFGNQINGADGQPLAIDTESNIEWANYKDKYGNTVFYDKANPSNILKPGGTSTYQSPTGYTSTPTSDSSGVQTLGEGDAYTRDNGTQGTLGENCVKWCRENVPNLPMGLVNKQNKIDAINYAVDQGFGGRGGQGAKIGDAILTGEGEWGHAAVITDIDEQGNLILAEANYKPGQITTGRKISMNDPKIYGYVNNQDYSPIGLPFPANQGTKIFGDVGNEGVNPSIETLVGVEVEQPQIDFSRKQKAEFDTFVEDDKLPGWVGSSQDEAKFMNDMAVYDSQPPELTPDQQKSVENMKIKTEVALKQIDTIFDDKLWKAAGRSALIPGISKVSLRYNDLEAALTVIQSNIALDEMKSLKEASPTGSTGFGAMNVKELSLLTDSKGTIRPNMSEAKLKENLLAIRELLRKSAGITEGQDQTNQVTNDSGTTSSGIKFTITN